MQAMENKLRRLILVVVLEAFITVFSEGEGKYSQQVLQLLLHLQVWHGCTMLELRMLNLCTVIITLTFPYRVRIHHSTSFD